MKVLLTGGGTGGHITPLLAVAQTLKTLDPSVEIIYVGERNSKYASMTEGQANFDQHYHIYVGKVRRYHGESWAKRLLDFKTNFLNLRDAFYVLIGTVQSWFLLRRIKPDVILLKGGFVGVPIGLAARRHYPMVTHDSDALPGLANRLAGRWAVKHATGMPAHFYKYPQDSIAHTGVLLSDVFVRITPALQNSYKKELGLPQSAQLVYITGGSGGAQNINNAIAKITPKLLEDFPKLHIILQAGIGKTNCFNGYTNERLQVLELAKDMYRYMGAADVVVTRAGATTVAELGAQGKATIVVPNPLLTGGHQLLNAEEWAAKRAVDVVSEASLQEGTQLRDAIEDLLKHDHKRQHLGKQLHEITVLGATDKLARLLLSVAEQGQGNK